MINDGTILEQTVAWCLIGLIPVAIISLVVGGTKVLPSALIDMVIASFVFAVSRAIFSDAKKNKDD
jgi:hypothetical protein